MPRRPCLAHGCPQVISRGSYCVAHQPRSWTVTERVLARDGYLCRDCGQTATTTRHIVALVDGGTNTEDNIQAACTEHGKGP